MTRRQRLTLIATILGSTVVFLDSTIVNVALPSIGRELGAGLAGAAGVGIRNPRREVGSGDDDAFPSAPPSPGGNADDAKNVDFAPHG